MHSKLVTKKLKIYSEHEKVQHIPQITKAYFSQNFNGIERYTKVVSHAEYCFCMDDNYHSGEEGSGDQYKKLDKKRWILQ